MSLTSCVFTRDYYEGSDLNIECILDEEEGALIFPSLDDVSLEDYLSYIKNEIPIKEEYIIKEKSSKKIKVCPICHSHVMKGEGCSNIDCKDYHDMLEQRKNC
jgi:hypothetical protein